MWKYLEDIGNTKNIMPYQKKIRCLTSFPEKAILYYVKQICPKAVGNYRNDNLNITELDIYIHSLKIGIEYDGLSYHKNLQKDLDKYKACQEQDILLYRMREDMDCKDIKIGDKLFKSSYIAMGNKSKMAIFSLEIKEMLRDIFKKEIDVDILRDYNIIRETYITPKQVKSLADVRPDIACEWDYENNKLTPDKITSRTYMSFFWKCPKCNNSYKARVEDRTRKGYGQFGCPNCTKKYYEGLKEYPTIKKTVKHSKIKKCKKCGAPFEDKSESQKNLYCNCCTICRSDRVKKEYEKFYNKNAKRKVLIPSFNSIIETCSDCGNKFLKNKYNSKSNKCPECQKRCDYVRKIKPNKTLTCAICGKEEMVSAQVKRELCENCYIDYRRKRSTQLQRNRKIKENNNKS